MPVMCGDEKAQNAAQSSEFDGVKVSMYRHSRDLDAF